MNDDLEPSLGDHLRHRASRVHPTPDLDDVHHRIEQKHQRRTRALGAALAVALVAGPVLGWTLARANEPDKDTLTTASGGDASGGAGDQASYTEGWTSFAEIGLEMTLLSERTTNEGIRLVVHTTELGSENGPCSVDGMVRVGVVGDGDLIDVVVVPTAPGSATFQVAGTMVGRPVWVVVARGYDGRAIAEFPKGSDDEAVATDGIAVLASYAEPGRTYEELRRDVITVNGSPAVDEGRDVTFDDGNAGCPQPGDAPPVTMPEPGEPPADEAAARAEIEALFSGIGGRDPDTEAPEHERPNVWRDADQRFREEHPDYLEWAKQTESVPLEIVFTAPDRATVRYELVSDNAEIPVPGERVGEAVLIDGTWKVSIETSCGNLRLAGIECDLSIEG